jgi:hypothetical protein
VPFSTAVRTSRKGCTVARFQRICCASHGAFSRQEDIIGSSEDPRFECPNGVQG